MQWSTILIAFSVISTVRWVSALETTCQYDAKLFPCRCNPYGFHSLVCENLQDVETLTRSLRRASSMNLQEVSVRYSSFRTVPLETIHFFGFIFLNLRSVKVDTMFENVPPGRVRIEQLHLDTVKSRKPHSWKALSSLSELKRLAVLSMILKKVDSDFVSYISETLQSLSLTSTGTEYISSEAFANFRDLVYISIQNTEVSKVKRSMFPSPAKIRYFYFGKNKISSLPGDIFSNMPELRSIGLQDNWIAEIDATTFGSVWSKLTTLFLAGNPIKCYCDMSWITRPKKPRVLTGSCQTPKAKYGKRIKALKKEDFC